jgi:glucosylceramidase
VNDNYFYLTYAKYLIKVLDTYAKQGVSIDYLTLQNEPLFGNGSEYPGMFLSQENAVRLFRALFPLLKEYNSKYNHSVEVMAYDHNWDVYSYPDYVLSSTASDSEEGEVTAVAWHCYGGEMTTAHEAIHEKYPNARQYITECTGSFPDSTCDINKGMIDFGFNHEWDMSNILLGAASHWSSSGIKWILALDENCGPILSTVSYDFGRPLVSIPSFAMEEDDIKWNQDYYSIGHMSKFLSKGSYRVKSAINNDPSKKLLSETFYSPVTNEMTCMVMNYDHTNSLSLIMSDGNMKFEDVIPSFSTKVYSWKLNK